MNEADGGSKSCHILMPQISISEIASCLKRDFLGFGGYDGVDEAMMDYCKMQDVYITLELVALSYLGCTEEADFNKYSVAGINSTIEYFFGDWKRTDENTKWFTPLSRGLILGLLADRPHDVTKLCSWIQPNLRPEFEPYDPSQDVELAQLFQILAARWTRRQGESEFKLLENHVGTCKKPRIKRLYGILAAIDAGDQSDLRRTLIDSVSYFKESVAFGPRNGQIADRLALPETALYLSGLQWGMKPLDLPKPVGAYILLKWV